jgi:hypothetical protein
MKAIVFLEPIPVKKLEMIAYLLRTAAEESAAGLDVLSPYSDSSKDTVERRAFDSLNEIDSMLAVVDGVMSDHLGTDKWRYFEERGREQWEKDSREQGVSS